MKVHKNGGRHSLTCGKCGQQREFADGLPHSCTAPGATSAHATKAQVKVRVAKTKGGAVVGRGLKKTGGGLGGAASMSPPPSSMASTTRPLPPSVATTGGGQLGEMARQGTTTAASATAPGTRHPIVSRPPMRSGGVGGKVVLYGRPIMMPDMRTPGNMPTMGVGAGGQVNMTNMAMGGGVPRPGMLRGAPHMAMAGGKRPLSQLGLPAPGPPMMGGMGMGMGGMRMHMGGMDMGGMGMNMKMGTGMKMGGMDMGVKMVRPGIVPRFMPPLYTYMQAPQHVYLPAPPASAATAVTAAMQRSLYPTCFPLSAPPLPPPPPLLAPSRKRARASYTEGTHTTAALHTAAITAAKALTTPAVVGGASNCAASYPGPWSNYNYSSGPPQTKVKVEMVEMEEVGGFSIVSAASNLNHSACGLLQRGDPPS